MIFSIIASMFIEIFPSGPLETNAILIGCSSTKEAIVIDPAFQSAEKLIRKAADEGLDVKKIYLTHSHWDHTADLAKLKKKLEVPLYVHELDAKNVEIPGSDGLPLYIPIEPATPDIFLEEGQEHSIGNLTFRVIHTPGHSPGSVCFYFEKEKVLISGDTLFKGSFGKVCFPGSSEEDMVFSLEKLARLPKDTRVIPGHGSSTTIGQETWLERAQEYLGY